MADGLNRVTLLGNLCQDSELRHTQGGQAILNMRLACSESWYDKDSSERKERVEYVTCILWGKRAEALAKFLDKGSKLCVEGRLQTRSWEDKSGAKRYTTEVVATNVVLLGSKGERGSGGDSGSNNDYAPTGGGGVGGGFGNDDIPF